MKLPGRPDRAEPLRHHGCTSVTSSTPRSPARRREPAGSRSYSEGSAGPRGRSQPPAGPSSRTPGGYPARASAGRWSAEGQHGEKLLQPTRPGLGSLGGTSRCRMAYRFWLVRTSTWPGHEVRRLARRPGQRARRCCPARGTRRPSARSERARSTSAARVAHPPFVDQPGDQAHVRATTGCASDAG